MPLFILFNLYLDVNLGGILIGYKWSGHTRLSVPGVHLDNLRAGTAVVHRSSDVRGGSVEVLSTRVH